MGCCITTMMNQNQTKITSKIKSDDNEILNTSKAAEIKTVKDFIITEGILVKETKADPYDIYDSLKVLGEGAFGKVEKVKHKISKQIRAMKVIHKDQIQLGSEDEQALINEIKSLCKKKKDDKLLLIEAKDEKIYIKNEIKKIKKKKKKKKEEKI